MARTLVNLSSDFRTKAGRSVHTAGMVLAVAQLAWALWLASEWGWQSSSLVLVSGFCYATSTYVLGRLCRRVVDRRSARRTHDTAAGEMHDLQKA